MNLSYLSAVMMIVAASFIFGGVTYSERKNFETVLSEQSSQSFLNYVDAAQNYKTSNPSATGNITANIQLQSWQQKNNDITVYSVSGKFYVYMPSKPGVYSQLRDKSGDSVSFGITENNNIITSFGSISKPSQIPNNYVVFIL